LRLAGAGGDGVRHGRTAPRQACAARPDRRQPRRASPFTPPDSCGASAGVRACGGESHGVIPTLPLGARNRLAATILAALHDPSARLRLANIAEGAITENEWLGSDGHGAGVLLRQRAESASRALASLPLAAAEPSLADVLAQAAAFFDAGLAFEVHELL